MKKLIYFLICAVTVFASCSDDNKDNSYQTHAVTVQLTYPAGYSYSAQEGVVVKLQSTNSSGAYEGKTDASGKAVVTVPNGIYNISASESRLVSAKRINFNGRNTGVVVNNSWAESNLQEVELELSQSASILIKELYAGGCQKDDGSGQFFYDSYVILYNNSEENVDISKMALAQTKPSNAQGNNHYYENGQLIYANKGWIPAAEGFWYFQNSVILQPGKQIVIALSNAIDNTLTYTKSINFANSEYYCTYDNALYTHAKTYPAPSSAIPTSHHLKAYRFGLASAWTLSVLGPAFYVFEPIGTDLKSFVEDPSTTVDYNGNNEVKAVSVDWITDGVEVFPIGTSGVKKRLTSAIDDGSVLFEKYKGYSVYRNVDKELTESIEGNKDKLIRIGSATSVSADPSGIDAEASIKNGARIIYKDTNNSTEDFHQRGKASLAN